MSEKALDAVVAGLTCLDMTPVFVTPEIEEIGEILIPSRTLMIGKADIHCGGCVSNTGLAMKIFGSNVRLMGKVGNDEFGQIVLKQYRQFTSTESMIVSETEGTAYSVVLAPSGIDRIFLHYPGGNDTFCAKDIDYDLAAQARLFHFGYPQAMKQMYLNEGEELVSMFKRIREAGTATSLDTCGIDEHAEAAGKDWRLLLKRVMPYVDFFVPSAEELCYMMDKKRFQQWEKRAEGKDLASILSEADVEPLADELLSWGAKVVMIKCGSAGLYFSTASREALAEVGEPLRKEVKDWNDVRHFEKCFKPHKILSATGAGDTCIAAFLTSILRGCGWEQCVQYAAAAGAACLETYDALGGLPSFEELGEKIAAGWEKNNG